MRVILLPNGAVIDNYLDVDIVRGQTIETDIRIPGYVPGTLTLITDIPYNHELVPGTDIIRIRMYIPTDYGGEGQTQIVISYGTTSIYGIVFYIYDIDTRSTSRILAITNNTGSTFYAEIGVGEGGDIHKEREVTYVIVGDITVMEGTHQYTLPATIDSTLSFYVDVRSGSIYEQIDMVVNGGVPIPGVFIANYNNYHLNVPIEGSRTITDMGSGGVAYDVDTHTLHVYIPTIIHLVGVRNVEIVSTSGRVVVEITPPGLQLPIGTYTLSNITYI